eukprot:CAMPEP_0175935958 /NCGR_PEP_ID=MMETSP0108-20121206/21354_1 /TAXON_ID=195067 ORGANISM="Goniomonas pacifica, Strain CCMP1869" /NCGR_SAMPLE_ID=MMETSP0108 /ASSEMBLY_ACC=CAM_ASM_000204 /LENGTH=79 /DNA_ID=CAMNT_0017260005 /DNA_START=46 /DNA_END=282 /DNA_ORIENTATION=+
MIAASRHWPPRFLRRCGELQGERCFLVRKLEIAFRQCYVWSRRLFLGQSTLASMNQRQEGARVAVHPSHSTTLCDAAMS